MPNIDRNVYDNMRRVLQAAGQLEQVTQSFCSNSDERIAAIFRAIENEDTLKILEIAHALKGSCAMFGAKGCAEFCQQIETACSDNSAEIHYEHLRHLTLNLQEEIREIYDFIQCQIPSEKPECCP
jgi:HPt (histidine-containing phosphotransfer) domain-containing protein